MNADMLASTPTRSAASAPARPGYDRLDAALDALGGYGPDLANGMTSHAPMVAEALCAMGRASAVAGWVARYSAGMLPWPQRRRPIAPSEWRAALAQMDRVADWRELFDGELRGTAWQDVVERWIGRLAPGMCANAAHGVIRVGHAVRALADADTPARRRELRDGFATWAASYQVLPTAPFAAAPSGSVAEALARVPLVPPERRRFAGTIVSALVGLDEAPEFAPVIGLLDVERDPAAVAAELLDGFTRVYLANADDFLTTIVLVHAVTSTAALGHLLPYLRDETARDALRFAWQTGCGLYAAFGSRPPADRPVAPPAEDVATLIDMAIAHGDEHAIKFTEVCAAQFARTGASLYLAAARHSMTTLPQV